MARVSFGLNFGEVLGQKVFFNRPQLVDQPAAFGAGRIETGESMAQRNRGTLETELHKRERSQSTHRQWEWPAECPTPAGDF